MPIDTLLVDNLIASTKLNPNLVPALSTPATKGPIISHADLKTIAGHVDVNLAADGADTSHARPTMLAGISSFVENVETAWNAASVAAMPNNVRQDFLEWQGMMAAVALSNIYRGMGLDLSVTQVTLNPNDAAMRCVQMEMAKDAKYAPAAAKCVLYYICQKGTPFAIYHPEIGLCPMREYDPNLFDGVLTWYKKEPGNCHAGWQDILTLDDFCLSRIAWWANTNNLILYNNYLVAQKPGLPALPAALAVAGSVQNAGVIDNVWAGNGTKFGTAMQAYLDVNGNPQPVPELFLNKMMISGIGSAANNRMVYNTAAGPQPICFTGDGGLLANYVPVPPFKEGIMDLLNTCTLNALTFTADLNQGGALQSVTVSVTIDTPTGLLKLDKVYGRDQLSLGQMPYLKLWPFVPMPAGMKLWTSYYATWHPQTQGLVGLVGIGVMAGQMGYAWGTQGLLHQVFRPTAVHDSWPVCVGSAPFRYAVLTSTNIATNVVAPVGLLFMPEYPTFPAALGIQAPVTMAVDFGTTSTVCALQSPALPAITTLPFKDYSKCVSCEDDTARDTVNMMRWLGSKDAGPAWQWAQKLFSIAQLFDQNPPVIAPGILPAAANREYYVDGRLFLASGDALVSLAGSGGAGSLEAQGIMTDMKFNHALDVNNYHAATVFLSGIYMHAVLYLFSQNFVPTPGVNFMDLRVSYPNGVTLGALNTNWGFAVNVLNRVMGPSLTAPINTLLVTPASFYTEATAATAYQAATNPALFANGLVSMDIGGGTTDISISNDALHPGAVRNLSIRYAGREIMVSSLVEFYRKHNPAVPSIVDGQSFSNIWPGTPDAATLCNQFDVRRTPDAAGPTIPFLHGLTNDSTARMSVEMLLAMGMNMGPASNLNPTNLPRQLIAMKFIMLLRVAASAVRENIDMWKDAHGNLATIGDSLQINLSVNGTGAQLLQYVFDCTMPNLVALATPAVLPAGQMKDCLDLMNEIFDDVLSPVLPDGIKTDLHIHVDPDVAQKLDVSYGMLQPAITGLAPAVPPVPMTAATRAAKEAAMQNTINASSFDDLNNYINCLLPYWKKYEGIYFPAPMAINRGLGPNVKVMTDVVTQANLTAYFTTARRTVQNHRAAYMIEPEQAPYVDQLTGMYLVEEILDWVIAQHQ